MLNGIIIFAHKDRKREAAVNQKLLQRQAAPYGLEVKISLDETEWHKESKANGKYKGMMQNFMQALEMKWDTEGYTLVLHDDCILPPRGLENIQHILQFAPGHQQVSFYNPTNTAYREALAKQKHVLKSQANFWPQCMAYPHELKQQMLEWTKQNVTIGYEGDDWLMSVFCHYNERYVYSVLPSVVQHLGRNRSVIGIAGTIAGVDRKSENYNPDTDYHAIDWKAEFANPAFDSRKTREGNGLWKIVK